MSDGVAGTDESDEEMSEAEEEEEKEEEEEEEEDEENSEEVCDLFSSNVFLVSRVRLYGRFLMQVCPRFPLQLFSPSCVKFQAC